MVATSRQRRRESAREIPLPPAYGASADLGRRRPTMVAALTRSQRRFVEMRGRQILWRAANQLGKAQPLTARILTPSGWTTMGALRVGSEVIAGDGSVTTVTEVHPAAEMRIVRLTFDDGATTECSEQHLWTVRTPESRFSRNPKKRGAWSEMEAGEIARRWGERPDPTRRVSIPVVGAWDGATADLPIPGYLLGALLGDGGMTADVVVLTNPDDEIVDRVRALLPAGVEARATGEIGWRLAVDLGCRNPLIAALRSLGLMGCGSHEKFIPDAYMSASYADRLELLRGLMDTDGDIGLSGCATFSSTSQRLAEGLRDLVRSLGGKADIANRQTHFTYKGEYKAGRPSFRVSVRLPGVDVFHLARKAERRRDPATTSDRVLVSIEPSGSAVCRCITVAHPSGTYVTDDYIVTHNSYALAYKIIAIIEAIGPYANRAPGPLRILVVSESKEQMEPLHRKLWELLPKDRIELETTEYIPGFGFRGKPPRITFTAGPGAGTVIVFATYAQGAKRIAGGTYDIVAADEPLPQKIYSECLMRCMHGNPGELWITLTMTPASPDVTYLREKVTAKEVIELHTPLTVDAMRLEQSTACLWKGKRTPEAEVEANIEEFSRLMLAQERDMRINGGWEATIEDRILDNWGPHCVTDMKLWPGAYVAVGFDHGTGPRRQTAVLMQFDLTDLIFPRVGLLAEWRSPNGSNPEDDARATLAMLERYGLNWRHVDAWWGDRATSTNRWGAKKDNKELHDHLALEVLPKGQPLALFPYINTPNKARFAVEYGYRLLNACMGRTTRGVPHFQVDKSCVEFAKSAARHNGRQPKDPLKDMLDPVRYCLVEAVKPKNFVGLAMLAQ